MSNFALISLISDQPMPNVMAVLQRERNEQTEENLQRFTHLEFIVSADQHGLSNYDRRFDEICKRIEAYFTKRGYSTSRRPPVDPYNLGAILHACQQAVEALQQKKYTVVFNITGGTKIMSLAAYLCAQLNHLEAIYVDSRDRFLISISPTNDLKSTLKTEISLSEKKPLDEELFCEIDVPTYLSLYGREINTWVQVDELDEKEITQAQIIAAHYATLRKRLVDLQKAVDKAYKDKTLAWPFQMQLEKVTKREKAALEHLNTSGIISWEQAASILACNKPQKDFLKGRWLEVYALYTLAKSGLFHDVRGNVKIKGWDGECDVVLTVNAQLAIIECKSEARLSEQLAKIRAIQFERGGLFGRSFFIRSGETDPTTIKHADFYRIDKVIDAVDLPKLIEIVAGFMGVPTGKK